MGSKEDIEMLVGRGGEREREGIDDDNIFLLRRGGPDLHTIE